MKKIHISILLIFTILLICCAPESLDINIEQAESKLVIGSQVITDQIVVVTVSKSYSAIKDSSSNLLKSLLVTDAIVSITHNGTTNTLTTDPSIPGVYMGLISPLNSNIEYTLNVSDPDTKQHVTSKSKMLNPVSFLSVKADSGNNKSIKYIDVTMNIPDSPTEINYYMVNIYNSNINQIQSGSIDKINSETVLISDLEYGNGNNIIKTHRIYDWNADTVFTTLSNITSEYYNFLLSREKSGNLSSQVISEPINYPTNITDGYGYFNMHLPTTKTIKVN